MRENEEITVEIEKFSNLGTGIAKVDGQVVFVENTCPKDVVKIKLIKVNKNYATAKVLDVVTPSPYRIKPFCPMQNVCGACQMQFIDYDYQLELKKQIVEDTMRTIGHIETLVNPTISSPQNKNYRHKIQYPISQTKISGRILAGYYKPQTHEIVNIKYCPIQPEICDKIIDFIRENAPKFKIFGFNEKKHLGDLRHVVIRCSAENEKCLVTLVINSTGMFNRLESFAKSIFDAFEDVVGVCVNFNSKKTNVILGQKTECVCGQDYIEEKLIDKTFKIGADTFFQVNPKSAENIFKYVKGEISKFDTPTVLDAYAGIATFGIVVSDISGKVTSVEENKASIDKAKEVLTENKITNVELFAQDTTKFLKSIKRKFDITILDPPRKGCSQEALDETLSHTKHEIIYVSCNPATLARDLKYLKEKGCNVRSIQPFDMFCHTYHVETVAIVEI
jgi:23S rRNA (uracil1939-C5)-methyltransferase